MKPTHARTILAREIRWDGSFRSISVSRLYRVDNSTWLNPRSVSGTLKAFFILDSIPHRPTGKQFRKRVARAREIGNFLIHESPRRRGTSAHSWLDLEIGLRLYTANSSER